MVSLADLSQPAGLTAALSETEVHFCASRLLAECVRDSFPQRAEEQGEHPRAASAGRGESRRGQSPLLHINSCRLCRADTGCLLSLAALKYQRRQKKGRHCSQAGAVCGDGSWVK